MELTPLERTIYNDGERLIPGVTHDRREFIRHLSSYLFCRRIIQNDQMAAGTSEPVSIVDLGCGTGHGCCTLSEQHNSQVLGVDSSAECIKYAQMHYGRMNVRYELHNLVEYIPGMPEFDYAVSRGVLEHIPGGLDLALRVKWRKRLMFDVPYGEESGANPHHIVTRIREDAFAAFPGAELFYEDLDGAIFDAAHRPSKANLIVCICSRADLPKVALGIPFPVPPCEILPHPQPPTGLRRLVRGVEWRLDAVLGKHKT